MIQVDGRSPATSFPFVDSCRSHDMVKYMKVMNQKKKKNEMKMKKKHTCQMRKTTYLVSECFATLFHFLVWEDGAEESTLHPWSCMPTRRDVLQSSKSLPKWHGSSTWEATVFMFSYFTFEFLKTDMTIMTICFFGDFAIDCLAVETPKSTKMKILVYRFRGWTMTFDLLNDSWTLQRRRGIENISLKLVDWFTWGILQW